MIDYNQDGKINCIDYAIEATAQVQSAGIRNVKWLITEKENKGHVVIMFETNGNVYVVDGDVVYCTRTSTSTQKCQ